LRFLSIFCLPVAYRRVVARTFYLICISDIVFVSVGHINHSLFWKNLAGSAVERKGNGGVLKDGPLKTAICERWGSLDILKKEFNTTTAAIQGSGWGWIVRFPPHKVTRGFRGMLIN
jgi:Fe-Mn family superoxide dismutase